MTSTPRAPRPHCTRPRAQLDLSVAEVRPDEWLSCNDACKLSWAESWVRVG